VNSLKFIDCVGIANQVHKFHVKNPKTNLFLALFLPEVVEQFRGAEGLRKKSGKSSPEYRYESAGGGAESHQTGPSKQFKREYTTHGQPMR
jgi:hypothetical protein